MGSDLVIPSYQNGFAPRDGPPEYPDLRTELALNWHGPLGPTGLAAKDTSGYGNDGTLHDMDPATDWVMTPHGWGPDFDGSDDNISFPCPDIHARGTIWILCRANTASQPAQFIVSHRDGGSDTRLGIWHGTTTYRITYGATALISTGVTISTTGYQSLALEWSSAAIEFFADGVRRYTGALPAWTGNWNNLLWLAEYAGGGSNWHGGIIACAGWDRLLKLNEIQLLYRDPHAIVRPKQRVFFASAGAPPSFAGSNLILGGGVL